MSTDIKPDTSLYTTPADRLAAFAMALRDESTTRPLQSRVSYYDDVWEHVSLPARSYPGMASNCLDGVDYRLKPEPRVVWIMERENGTLCDDGYLDHCPEQTLFGYKPVRFVESPE